MVFASFDIPSRTTADELNVANERGGAFSTNRKSIPYSPYEQYVGVRVPEGSRRGLHAVLVLLQAAKIGDAPFRRVRAIAGEAEHQYRYAQHENPRSQPPDFPCKGLTPDKGASPLARDAGA